MTTAAIVPAAGRGERLGPGTPKALRPLGGAPLLVHATRSLALSRVVDLVLVAVRPEPESIAEAERLLADFEWGADIRVVPGGADRRLSVEQALTRLPGDVDVVLVHDAARPLAPPELADAVVARIRSGAVACIPALPVSDLVGTVKEVEDDTVVRTLDRNGLYAIQTPQGFRRDVLTKAHAWAATATPAELAPMTDDAALVERIGLPVAVVPGSGEAFKVTRPLDLTVAEALLARRRADGST